MHSISPLSGILPLGSSTSESGSRGKHSQPQLGQTFKAVVVETKGSFTFILEIGGNKITAQSQTQLSIGQTLQLQVMSTAPQVELRILGDSTNLLSGKSITLLGKNIDIKALFESLHQVSPSPLSNLNSLSRQTLESYFHFNQEGLLGKDGGGLLKSFIDRLGLSFEALLARGEKNNAQLTLKSALLELAQAFKGAGHLAESTNKLLSTIELYQLMQLQLEKENIFIFPLPMPFLEKGYLLVEDFHRESDTDDSETDNRFSLHLALEGLGNLRIDLLQSKQGIYIKFICDSKDKLQFLEQFSSDLLPDVIDRNTLKISFSQEHVDPAADLLRRLVPEGESIVNTKV
ncbi:hypothetical protein [Desulfopila inferna]|uniref:hypothetical protein n=1 Tax=Desulfopila inferna TaxID=468528 RepID=UPI001966121C|nr:hypothetical protein [Desulfopila inferna]MBM9603022.1 hypothetical protein [Desulfopila inferna]